MRVARERVKREPRNIDRRARVALGASEGEVGTLRSWN